MAGLDHGGTEDDERPITDKPEKSKDAFAALMSSNKRKHPESTSGAASISSSSVSRTGLSKTAGAASRSQRSTHSHKDKFREALGDYLANPEALIPKAPPGNGASAASLDGKVIYVTPDFVAIHDKFPKASVHCLLLPRDPERNLRQPVSLLCDPEQAEFLEQVRAEADKLKKIVASELRRQFGAFSAQDAERQAVLRGDVDLKEGVSELPPGRDWEKEVLVGVHSRPSMSHLHIHVLSRDMHSTRAKHRKHYNSFTTPFLVPLSEFPLDPDDPRRPREDRLASAGGEIVDGENVDMEDVMDTRNGHVSYLKSNMKCWRCGRDFGNKFKELKGHLDEEFEKWKRE